MLMDIDDFVKTNMVEIPHPKAIFMARMGIRLYLYTGGLFWEVHGANRNLYGSDTYIKLYRNDTELINFIYGASTLPEDEIEHPTIRESRSTATPIRQSILSYSDTDGLNPEFKFFARSFYEELLALSIRHAERLLEEYRCGVYENEAYVMNLLAQKIQEYKHG